MLNTVKYTFVLFFIAIASCSKRDNYKSVEPNKQEYHTEAGFVEYQDLNYGSIKDASKKYVKTLVLKNISKKVVVINEVSAGCSCLSFNLHEKSIKPSDSISIRVSFFAGNKKGYFSKIIFITLNDGRNYITPYVYGFIE